jgi:hypothetical protein
LVVIADACVTGLKQLQCRQWYVSVKIWENRPQGKAKGNGNMNGRKWRDEPKNV